MTDDRLTLRERSLLATAADYMALHLERMGNAAEAADLRAAGKKVES